MTDTSKPTSEKQSASAPAAANRLWQIPAELRLAAKDSKLVIFVGAGVSALCDSPLWDAFANKLVDHLRAGNEPLLTYLEIEQLKSIADARRRASIAKGLAKELGVPIRGLRAWKGIKSAREFAGREVWAFSGRHPLASTESVAREARR